MTDQPYTFRDSEPEDAWDAGDPPAEQLRNVIRRLALALEDLETVRARIERRRDDDG